MATNNNKTNNQSVNNQSANSLQYVTYTSATSGKTIPVVYGFTGKEDERLPYIAVLEQPKAKKGKKVQRVHGPAYGTYSRLPLGKDGERIPCVIWGADPRWQDIAKRAAEIINDLDALTQEDYDDLCAKAEAVYEAKKAESKATEGTETKKVQPKGSTKPVEPVCPKVAPSGTKAGSKPTEKPKSEQPKQPKKPTSKPAKTEKPTAQEVSLKATKPAPAYTEAALMASFEQLAKAMHLSKDNKNAIENFMKAVIKEAKAA